MNCGQYLDEKKKKRCTEGAAEFCRLKKESRAGRGMTREGLSLPCIGYNRGHAQNGRPRTVLQDSHDEGPALSELPSALQDLRGVLEVIR